MAAEPEHEWSIHNLNDEWLGLRPPVTLIDGSKSGRLVMRRKIDGAWQYRAPTPAEEFAYLSEEAW